MATRFCFSTSARIAPGSCRRRFFSRTSMASSARFGRGSISSLLRNTTRHIPRPSFCPGRTDVTSSAKWSAPRASRSCALRRRRSIRTSLIFLMAGSSSRFRGEDRKIVPSPKVATYDLQPEMSARDPSPTKSFPPAQIRFDHPELRQPGHGGTYRRRPRRRQSGRDHR